MKMTLYKPHGLGQVVVFCIKALDSPSRGDSLLLFLSLSGDTKVLSSAGDTGEVLSSSGDTEKMQHCTTQN